MTEAAEAAAGEPEPIVVLGIDETRRGRPRWTFSVEAGRWVRTDAWDTGFVDLAGDQGLLGQTEGRTSAGVIGWLQARTPKVPGGDPVCGDRPAAVYAKAVTTPGLGPNAAQQPRHGTGPRHRGRVRTPGADHGAGLLGSHEDGLVVTVTYRIGVLGQRRRVG